ncbi:IclR family transcriptional regulator [Peterkaempfera bronchialis]|uniref:Glycerol operon regulatory protein n=1 Tax=Peterkaempfera bronchialis TaxID=2126346 RepID=A0A345SR80_9ACTN|nr:IclR family transcriptional regulator [Peterkaempfera bronchialis]AXI76235.1 IclR family transcriptional regulator [Peterkaempfera bronchialis]
MRNAHTTEQPSPARSGGGVQSIERAFDLLEALADSGGSVGLSGLAQRSGLPLPTIHRLIRTLVDLGYVRQEQSRQYVLGPRLIRLGESAGRLLSTWAMPHLAGLVEQLGETANLAMLDGDQVVYVAQVPGRHAMRMFTEVGRRVSPHCTAVGKALLADAPEAEVLALLKRTGMAQHTEHTITDPQTFLGQLGRVREHGYALDDGEHEIGVRCVAARVPDAPSTIAFSISGPAPRMTQELIDRAVPLLSGAAEALSAALRADQPDQSGATGR